jgi:hypothetical protein
MSKTVYVVIAYRFGKREKHSYTLGVFTTKYSAKKCADTHTNYRGGKYACVVESCMLNEFDNDAEDYTTEIYRTNSAL